MPRSGVKRSPGAKRAAKPKQSPVAERPERPKPCRPSGRTLSEFGRLSRAEKFLVDCCQRGLQVNIADTRPEKGTPANRVRAKLIRFLALGGDDSAPVHEYGVMLSGAWITGILYLEDAVLPSTLALQNCRIQKINAFRATIPTLVLTGSLLEKGMDAEDIRSAFGVWMSKVRTSGTVILRGARLDEFNAEEAEFDLPSKAGISLDLSFATIEGCATLNKLTANATIWLDNSSIKGDLECRGANFRSDSDFAIRCDGIDVGHNAYLREEFRSEGGVRMIGAKIGLTLDCSQARFEGKSQRALECERTKVSGPVFMSHSSFIGSVSLHSTSISGALICRGTCFEFPEGLALDCSSAAIGYVELSEQFSVKGQISFSGAEIKGNFGCNDIRLENPNSVALSLDDASIALSVLIEGETHVSGAVMLRGAKIGRDLRCQQVTFDEPSIDCDLLLSGPSDDGGIESLSISRGSVAGSVLLGPGIHSAGPINLNRTSVTGGVQCAGDFDVLSGRRASVSGDVRLARDFIASEEVTLAGAKIGGDLNCQGGRFLCKRFALDCDNAEIKGNVLLSSDFHAAGTVCLDNAAIGKSLNCEEGEFVGKHRALSLWYAKISGSFSFRRVKLKGTVDLTSAHAGVLHDDLKSWSGCKGRLLLDGFTYDRLNGPTGANERINWLKHQRKKHLGNEFRPQPWEQLITALRAGGHPISAREVVIARNDQLRRAGKVVLGARTLHRLYGLFVGYGYEPVRLLIVTIAVWLACAAVYEGAANPRDDLDPILISAPKEGNAEDASSFDPLFYSADVLLPIVDLGYSETWKPVLKSDVPKTKYWGRALRILRWLEIILGWLFGGALAAMLTQLVKRD